MRFYSECCHNSETAVPYNKAAKAEQIKKQCQPESEGRTDSSPDCHRQSEAEICPAVQDSEYRVTIRSCSKRYEAEICPDMHKLRQLSGLEHAFFVIDRSVYRLYREILFEGIPEHRLFLLDASEETKTAATALSICERMTEIPAKRNAWLVSFGGGITQDITGFAANILYRGVHWIFVPTTLLAACDSCIGGKTSLNYGPYKNLLGTFYAPDKIFICPQFFQTLTDSDFYSGLGEVVKFNLMSGETGLRLLEQNISRLLCREEDAVREFLMRSLEFKKPFIETDEFDRGVRIRLNFAHTFGHALETASRYAVPHGTAVAMGTIAANRISVLRSCLSTELAGRMEALLLQIIPEDAIDALNKSSGDSGFIKQVTDAMKKDKKQTGNEITAVLLTEAEKETASEKPAVQISLQVTPGILLEEAAQAVKYLLETLNSPDRKTYV